MKNRVFITAEQMAEELNVSKPYAYKIIRNMNEDLKQKGYLTIPGRVSRKYYYEKIYGVLEGMNHEHT